MGDRTGIEYLDATWSPLKGCERESLGCKACWAERTAARFYKPGEIFHGLTRNGRWTGDIKFYAHELVKPLRWRRPRRIGVCFMGDLFHKNAGWMDQAAVFAAMAIAQHHTFFLLTKRPWNINAFLGRLAAEAKEAETSPLQLCFEIAYHLTGNKKFFRWDTEFPGLELPLENVWYGASVENQKMADKRIKALSEVRTSRRWLSVEPLIEPVTLPNLDCMSWVVVGGESGPGARFMDPGWARALRDDCVRAKVPFFFKQMTHKGEIPDDLLVRELPHSTEAMDIQHGTAEKRGAEDRPVH